MLLMHLACVLWMVRSFEYLKTHGMVFKILFVLMALIVPMGLAFSRSTEGNLAVFAETIALSWLGIIFIFFSVSLVLGITEIIAGALTGSNFKLLFGVTGIALTVIFSILGFYGALKTPEVKVINASVKGFPAELKGLKMVQLTDLHLSATVPLGLLERTVEEVKALEPDLLVITGDFIDSGFNYVEEAIDLFKEITPKYGKYTIYGNHEFYTGIDKAKDFMEKAGFVILRHGNVKLANKLYLVGVDDIKTAHVRKEDIDFSFKGIEKNSAVIYLSHQPLMTEDAVRNGAGLMLSGHTHRGQIFPFNFLVKMVYPYFYGMYDVDGMKLYVSSGTHYWGPPLRLFLPSEIVMFVLEPEK